jgi:uncharacterized protein (DUF433 family)
MMKKYTKAIGVLALVAIVAALGVGMVSAQAEEPQPPTDSPFGQGGRGPRGPKGPDGGFGLVDRDAMHAKLAEVLGLTVDELDAARAEGESIASLAEANGVDLEDLQAAMAEARAEAIAQAVKDGTITQEQADQILERQATKGPGFDGQRGPNGGERPGLGLFDRDQVHEIIADVLGISVEELESARTDGTRLSELAEANGVEISDVEAAIAEYHAEVIAQAVEDGTITQEQADQMLEHQGSKGPGVGGQGRGRGRGPGMFGGEGGPRGGNTTETGFSPSNL